jgi:hypothetical protein
VPVISIETVELRYMYSESLQALLVGRRQRLAAHTSMHRDRFI